jgi:Ulp1 protease family, C-terminal catalytic domain
MTSPNPTPPKPVPFADDPFRGLPLSLHGEDVEALSGPHYLSTTLVDFVLQRGLPQNLPNEVLVASSNSMIFFRQMNANRNESPFSQKRRAKFQYYSAAPYHLLSAFCSNNHFYVINLHFHLTTDPSFDQVWVFDSLYGAQNDNNVPADSDPGQYLLELQEFLARFCAVDEACKSSLIVDPTLLLRQATYRKCPQQTNHHDCGLFAMANILHLVAFGVMDPNLLEFSISTAYQQQHIDQFRIGLHTKFTTDQDYQINWRFLCSFFSTLRKHNLEQPFSQPRRPKLHCQTDELFSKTAFEEPHEATPVQRHQVEDITFRDMFFQSSKTYNNLLQLNNDIYSYETTSGFRLVIQKSTSTSRTYKCRSHAGCAFHAKFGKVRDRNEIVVKKEFTNTYHTISPACDTTSTTSNGRSCKARMKGIIESSVNEVSLNKHDDPVAKDVMKAAARQGIVTSYNQAFRVVRGMLSKKCSMIRAVSNSSFHTSRVL